MRTQKELVTEIKKAHRALDRAGIPRKGSRGATLALHTRIHMLDFERRYHKK